MALSKTKRWLAIAEKHEKAPIVSIYDTQTLKRKKYIVSTDIGKSQEFISIAFAPTKEQYLITLTNEPGQTVCIWQWDKAKCLAYQPVTNNTNNVLGTQVSFSNTDHTVALITGSQTYKYFKMQENQQLKQMLS